MHDTLDTLIRFAKADVEPDLLETMSNDDLVALGKALQRMYPRPSDSVKKAMAWVDEAAKSRGLA